jgi:hypothetical protein
LFASRDTSHGVDAVIAASSLVIGVTTVLYCLRAPRHTQRESHAERSRARASKRQRRVAKRRARARR